MTRMDRQSIIVKDSAFGRDMLEILMEKQLKQVAFREWDVPQSIMTLKEHLVNKFAPQQGEYPSELRFLYPTYFDSARVLIAEYVAEFFQTGMILFSELDMERWEYIDHEIRALILTESEVDTLLRVLRMVQRSDHDMCARWKSTVDRNRWLDHIQEMHQVISQLK